ncbi:hypothetical protein SHM_13130 [Spiroplasma ixodetis]|uniref:Uncharacterized protein n=1 Tax=Spiroplasma ixodetis TaxID=2141 RepID=A0ABM8BUW4_9MOLU|nr:hypothetical protein SHM_13130 [Spiroplasma ixodetis]
MQDIAVQFEKHCWIHSVSLFPPQVHVGRSPLNYILNVDNKYIFDCRRRSTKWQKDFIKEYDKACLRTCLESFRK